MGRLIINNILIELEPSKPIARTLQVNDIANLQNRQANFTPTFSIPRTANNIRAFANLGIIGANSQTPYQRNNAYYYAESGECLVYNGWAIITATEKEFRCNLYDGVIDFYKAIENDTLAILPLDEINHIKTLDNVVDSINGLTTYKYILADYNGKALYDVDKINIDYLVPSTPVSYLWDKIFEYYGFTYSGSVFDTFNFQNLWMSFPKGTTSTIADDEMFDSSDITYPPEGGANKSRYFKYDTYTIDTPLTLFNDRHVIFPEPGTYRLEITGDISILTVSTREFSINLSKNQQANTNSADISSYTTLVTHPTSGTHTININQLITVDSDESLCLFIRATASIYFANNNLNVKISKVESSTIDFEGAFIDLKTKDFLNEILTRFSLTPFKDKYSNNIVFKTLQEVLQDTDVVDWSNKFDSVNSESYAYGSYAQQNLFRYKYNDAESDYNNGSINVENVNLQDSKDVIKSVIYSPEKTKTNVLPKETNTYKLWNKEPKDDGSVTYKSLDKRFYFLRADNYIFDSAVTIGSETLATEITIAQAPFESFFKLPFTDVIQDYYLPIYQILNNAKIINANIFLKEQDVINIDFSKLYWIEQLGNYFLLNKIVNFQGNGKTKCELIKVDYVAQLATSTDDTFNVSLSYSEGCFTITNFIANEYYFQLSYDNGVSWSTGSISISENPSCGFSTLIPVLVRLLDINGNLISNTILIEP